MDTAIERLFGDGKYRFHLNMPQILSIEGNDRSILKMHHEFGASLGIVADGDPIFMGGGEARMKDIASVIRHGLIGGGEGMVDKVKVTVSPLDATRIVETYVHGRPIAEILPVAWAILDAAVMGVRVDPKKKVMTGRRRSSPSAKAK
ncbi:MAG: gene transfer agent family protein [Pseudomonadota bacterium]